MNTPLASICIAVRSRAQNPWLDRLLASLQRHPTGLPRTDLLVEEGDFLTRVEKLNRLLRHAPGRYVALLEDDVEVLHSGWLAGLVIGMQVTPGIALAGPLEVGPNFDEAQAPGALQSGALEISNLPGFCLVADREAGLTFDVRCQTMSDLQISLAARARGWRLAKIGAAVLRHTKEPFSRDAIPPEFQTDRSRFGDNDAYYETRRHQAKRLAEARLLLAEYGDLARQTLPKELLAVVEPDAGGWTESQPGCWTCRQKLPPGDEWVMTRNGPQCFPCRFGKTAVGVLSVSPEATAAFAAGDAGV